MFFSIIKLEILSLISVYEIWNKSCWKIKIDLLLELKIWRGIYEEKFYKDEQQKGIDLSKEKSGKKWSFNFALLLRLHAIVDPASCGLELGQLFWTVKPKLHNPNICEGQEPKRLAITHLKGRRRLGAIATTSFVEPSENTKFYLLEEQQFQYNTPLGQPLFSSANAN